MKSTICKRGGVGDKRAPPPHSLLAASLPPHIEQGTKGRGIRHVIYWKHPNTEPGSQPMKVNLILYENDILQVCQSNLYCFVVYCSVEVTGSSFYLWVLDCYPAILKLVDFIIQEVGRAAQNMACW